MRLKKSSQYFVTVLIILHSSDVINGLFTNDELVLVRNGLLRGRDNGYYYSYESIPYAKAPIGQLRYENPQPYDDIWLGVFDATKKPVICMQWDQYQEGENKLVGSEDCLFVNVYKPKTRKEKYPVLAYIHGGAFMFSSVNAYGEDYLMKSGNIILVKLSYRLGPLGFLSTEDEVISGNYGLKDQKLALKWIKDNIHHFGGDPENILLMGFSAGSASTHLHMLHPYLQSIAKTAISFSGVGLDPWGINKNSRQRAIKLAQHLQCPAVGNTIDIKNCLKQQKAEDIVSSVTEFLNIGYNPLVTFGPVVEHKRSIDPFITEHPRDIIKSGNFAHIPWLASYTAQDGGYNAAELLKINPRTGKPLMHYLNEKWLELAPINLYLENICSDPVQYAQELKDKYLGNLTFSEETYFQVQELYTDVEFKKGIHEALKLHSQYGNTPVYSYVYDNPPDSNLGNILSQRNDIKFGTLHSDDFTLIMSRRSNLRPDEMIISHKLIQMVENFVATGQLIYDDCQFVDNLGTTGKLNILSITRNKCENTVIENKNESRSC